MPLVEQPTIDEGSWLINGDCDDIADLSEAKSSHRHHALAEAAFSSAWMDRPPTADEIPPLKGKCVPEGAAARWRDYGIEHLRDEFETLSNVWLRDTKHLSLVSKKITHPAYLRIIGIGEPVIPLLLQALRERPAHWFAALRATANCDPASQGDNPARAREAWIRWGIDRGLIDE